MFRSEYLVKRQSIFVSFEYSEFYFIFLRVSACVIECNRCFSFEISTHPNVFVFGSSKDGLDREGWKKAIDFSTDLIKSLFVISISLGNIQ